MSKAITSCKKALAYLLTAAMVLGMAVTSPVTAVEVKADDKTGSITLANGDPISGSAVIAGTKLGIKLESCTAGDEYNVYISNAEITNVNDTEKVTSIGQATIGDGSSGIAKADAFTAGGVGDPAGSMTIYWKAVKSDDDSVTIEGHDTVKFSYKAAFESTTNLTSPAITQGTSTDVTSNAIDIAEPVKINMVPSSGTHFITSAKATIPKGDSGKTEDDEVVNLEVETDGSVDGSIPANKLEGMNGDISVSAVVEPYKTLKTADDGGNSNAFGFAVLTGSIGEVDEKPIYVNCGEAAGGTNRQPLQFKVSEVAGYKVTEVKVTINNSSSHDNEGNGVVVLEGPGTYTIPASELVDNTTVTVTTVEIHNVKAVEVEDGYDIKVKDGASFKTNGTTVLDGSDFEYVVEKTNGGDFDPLDVVVSQVTSENVPDAEVYNVTEITGSGDEKYYKAESVGNDLYIKVKNQGRKDICLSSTPAVENVKVRLDGVDGYLSTSYTGKNPITIGKDFKLIVEPYEGYELSEVTAKFNTTPGTTLTTNSGEDGYFGEGNVKENNDGSWEITVKGTKISDLTTDITIDATATAIEGSVDFKMSIDKSGITLNTANVADYLEAKINNESCDFSGGLTVDNVGYGNSLTVKAKEVNDLVNSILIYEADDDEKTPLATTTENGCTVLTGGVKGNIIVEMVFQFPNTVKIEKPAGLTGVTYSFTSVDGEGNECANGTNYKTVEAGKEYRVKAGEKARVTVSTVPLGKSVSVTDKNNNKVEEVLEENCRGIGTYTTKTTDINGFVFKIRNDSQTFTLTEESLNGYIIKVKDENGIFKAIENGKMDVTYGDDVEFKIFDASGMVASDKITDSEGANDKALLICTMVDDNGKKQDIAATVRTGVSSNVFKIENITGDITVGAQIQKLDVTQSTIVENLDKALKVVASGSEPSDTPEKALYGKAYTFKVYEKNGTNYTPVTDTSKIRVKYQVAASVSDRQNYNEITPDANGVYKIDADKVKNKVFILAEYLHTITFEIKDSNVKVEATSPGDTNSGQKIATSSPEYAAIPANVDGLRQLKGSAFELLGGIDTGTEAIAGTTYNLYIKPQVKAGFEAEVKVDDVAKVLESGVVTIPLNVEESTTDFVFPEVISIGTKDVLHDYAVDVSGMKTPVSSLNITVKDMDNDTDVVATYDGTAKQYKFKVRANGTYRIGVSGLDTDSYTLKDVTPGTDSDGTGSATYATLRTIKDSTNIWELSGVSGNGVFTLEEDIATPKIIKVTATNTTIKTTYKYYYTESDRAEDGSTGALDKTDTTSSTSEISNVYQNADVKIEVTANENYVVKEVKVNDTAVTLVDGKYTIPKAEIIAATAAITVEATAELDESKYYVTEFTLDENAKIDGSASYTLNGTPVNAGTIVNGDKVLTDDGKITFTPSANGGYKVKSVTKTNAYLTGSGSYTLDMGSNKVKGLAGKSTVSVTTELDDITGDVYAKITSAGGDNVKYAVSPESAYNSVNGTYKLNKDVPELTLKIYVKKGYTYTDSDPNPIASATAYAIRKSAGRTAEAPEGEEGDWWMYEYLINGALLETAGATSPSAAKTVAILNPAAQKISLKNVSSDVAISKNNVKVDGTALAATGDISAGGFYEIEPGKKVEITIADSTKKLLVNGNDVCVAGTEGYKDQNGTRTYEFTPVLKDGADEGNTEVTLELVARTGLKGWDVAVAKDATLVEPNENGVYEYTDENDAYKIVLYRLSDNGSAEDISNTGGNVTYTIKAFKDGEEFDSNALTGSATDYDGSTSKNNQCINITNPTDSESEYTFKGTAINSSTNEKEVLDINKSVKFKRKGNIDRVIIAGVDEDGIIALKAGSEPTDLAVTVTDTNGEEVAAAGYGAITLDKSEDIHGAIKVAVGADNDKLTVDVKNALPDTEETFEVTVEGKKTTLIVKVKKPVEAEAITLGGSKVSLKLGKTMSDKVAITVTGKKDDKAGEDITADIMSDVQVVSSNPAVATAETTVEDGKYYITVSAVGGGSADITVSLAGVESQTIAVTVKPESSVPEETKGNIYIYVNDYSDPCAIIEGVIGKTISKGDVENAVRAELTDVNYLEGWYKNSTLRTRWDFATDVVEENTAIYGRALYEVEDDATGKTARIQNVWTQTYTGSVIKPSVVVTDEDGNLLKLNKDYKVSYNERNDDAKLGKDANVGLGGYSSDPETEAYYFTVNFVNDYSALGSRKVYYDIQPVNLNDAIVTLSDKTGQFVTDKNIKPVSSVKYGKKTLKLGTDYEYEVYNYENEVVATCSGTSYKGQKFDAGYYYIKLKGKAPNFVDQEYSDTYDYPQMVVQDAAKLVKNMTITNIKAPALTENSDHEIIPSVPTFEIKAKDMAKAVIFERKEGDAKDKDGTTVGSWSCDGDGCWTFSNAKKEEQFIVSFKNNSSVSTNKSKAEIYVNGCGYKGYFGEKTVKFAIKASDKLVKNDLISKDMQKKLAAVENVYCGEGITIEDIIENMNAGGAEYDLDSIVNKKYILGQHYIITYKKNVNKGTATMTFKGLGIYAGSSFTQNFKIVPIMISKPSDEDYRVGISSDLEALGAEVSGNAVVLPAECYKVDGKNLTDETLAKLLYDDEAERYLVNKVDYTVTVKTVRSSGSTYTYLIIKGKNNYSAKDGRTVPEIDIYKQAQAI